MSPHRRFAEERGMEMFDVLLSAGLPSRDVCHWALRGTLITTLLVLGVEAETGLQDD